MGIQISENMGKRMEKELHNAGHHGIQLCKFHSYLLRSLPLERDRLLNKTTKTFIFKLITTRIFEN